MSHSPSQNGRAHAHILLVCADPHDTAVLRVSPGAGLVFHPVNGATDDPCAEAVFTPHAIVVDFPADRPIDFAIHNRLRGQAAGRPFIVLGPPDDADCILSLEQGADDYLGKPIGALELAARLRAILRRRHGEPASVHPCSLLAGQDLDTQRRRLISTAGGETRLNTVEYELLRHFLAHPFLVRSRDDLAVALYHRQERHYELRSIDVFVNTLRQKLRDAAPYRLIRTERGRGYVFTPASS